MTGPGCDSELESEGTLFAITANMSRIGVHGSESRPLASAVRVMGEMGKTGIAAPEGMAENGRLHAAAIGDIALFRWMGTGTPVVIVREFT